MKPKTQRTDYVVVVVVEAEGVVAGLVDDVGVVGCRNGGSNRTHTGPKRWG